eukprot:s624_g1.t1
MACGKKKELGSCEGAVKAYSPRASQGKAQLCLRFDDMFMFDRTTSPAAQLSQLDPTEILGVLKIAPGAREVAIRFTM